MTHEEHLRAIGGAPDAAALKARHGAAIDAAFREFLDDPRRRRGLPRAQRMAKAEWDDRRRALHAAFAERLRQIGG